MLINAAASEIMLNSQTSETLIKICLDALPHKAYGLVGGPTLYQPKSFYPCLTNLRNTTDWKRIFESYGEFYKNPDLGFVIEPGEVRDVMDAMKAHKESFIGVFHSHRYLPAVPSEVDIALSSDPSVLCYIVSVANPQEPALGIFRIVNGGFQKMPICSNAQ